jgi:hypothetical protein
MRELGDRQAPSNAVMIGQSAYGFAIQIYKEKEEEG